MAEQALQQAASDPTAALMNVQIGDWYTDRYHHLNGDDANQVVLRSAIPYKQGDSQHIFRITLPYVTDSPFLDSGVSDTTIFDLTTFNVSWGRWGIGAVALLPTGGEHSGSEKWGLGPALGFVAHQKKFMWGLFNQNILTIAGDDDRDDVTISTLQPIINLSLGGGWSIGASEMTITYDWETSEFSNLPFGISLSKLHRFEELPVQFSAQYEHNFADDNIGAPETTFRITAKFIFPTIF